MPSTRFANPIDMEFGPSGDLFVLEYGTRWFAGNDDARLLRIQYTAGNRPPVVAAAVDRASGATPLRITLSSAGTEDLDEDSLTYTWTVRRANGRVVRTLGTAAPTITLAQPGQYAASLVVTDAHGARDSATVRIAAGNEPPVVDIDLTGGNRTFFFPGVPVRYAVRVSDREDGTLANGQIPARRVVVTADYVKDAAPTSVTGGDSAERAAFTIAAHEEGRRLIQSGTCLSCHQIDRTSIGPSYSEVAQRYRADTTAAARLARKIRAGGSGVWGRVMMPPHPQLSETQAAAMVAYILSLGEKRKETPSLPARGTYVPPDSASQGIVALRAAYADRGANGVPAAAAQKTIVLRAPTLIVASGDTVNGVQKYKGPEVPVEVTIGTRSGGFVGFRRIDLTGITAIIFPAVAPEPQLAAVGGYVEVRLDSASGPLVGQTDVIRPTATMGAPTLLRAPLAPTQGMRDLYFVFRNADAPQGRNLFVLTTATFSR